MKKRTVIYVLITFLGINNTLNAQFLKNLKDRVKERIEETITRKAENKAEEKAENTMDSLLVGSKKSKKKKASNKQDNNLEGMMQGIMNSKDVKTEQRYTFPITATIYVENYNKKTTSNTLKQSYGKNAIMSIMDASPEPIITDFKNDAAIILNEKKHTAQVMSMAWMKKMTGQNEGTSSSNNSKVTKTGNTKTLNSYTCYEYIITDNTIKMQAWFAPDVNFNYQDYLRGFSKMFSGKKQKNPSNLLSKDYGYVMEMTAYENNKKLTYMVVKQLIEKQKTIDLSAYQINSMF